MLTELNLTSLADHITKVVSLYGIKLIQSGTHSEFCTLLLSDMSEPSNLPKCIKVIKSEITKLNVPILSPNDNEIPNPPWKIVSANIKYPPFHPEQNKFNTLPIILKSQILEFIDAELNDYPNPKNVNVIYTDGSLISSTGKCGCAYVVYKGGTLVEKWAMPLARWSSSTKCELAGLEKAVTYALSNGDSLIITDSMSALMAIKSKTFVCADKIIRINKNLYLASVNNIRIKFLWTPSHINVCGNEEADKTARQITTEECPSDMDLSCKQLKTLLISEYKESVQLRTDMQRGESISIQHYDHFRNIKHFYGKAKFFSGPCDRIAARIRLGYRKIWEIEKDKYGRVHPEYSKCTLCEASECNTLEHYIVFCPILSTFRPPGMGYIELCLYFCKPEVLYPILGLYPSFKM